jgi:hypothetical protein
LPNLPKHSIGIGSKRGIGREPLDISRGTKKGDGAQLHESNYAHNILMLDQSTNISHIFTKSNRKYLLTSYVE